MFTYSNNNHEPFPEYIQVHLRGYPVQRRLGIENSTRSAGGLALGIVGLVVKIAGRFATRAIRALLFLVAKISPMAPFRRVYYEVYYR